MSQRLLVLFVLVGVAFVLALIGIRYRSVVEARVLGVKTYSSRYVRKTKIQPTVPPINKSKVKWGAYVGWLPTDVTTFESKVGKEMDYVATFVHWGNENEVPLDLGTITKSRGKTLVLYWEAMDYNVTSPEDPRFSYDAILAGKWDSYITDFAAQAKNFGGQIILIPFEEMNGDWYPWSGTKNGNSAAKSIAAYTYVHKFFKGIDNVKFGWTVNNVSSPDSSGNQILDYYPGDEVVDYVGINGFNFDDPWVSFAEVFNTGLARLETIDKPIIIFSMSCAPGTQKAAWITTGLGSELYKHPKIVGFIWFNENKEKDWRVWSDANSLAAFKAVIK